MAKQERENDIEIREIKKLDLEKAAIKKLVAVGKRDGK